MMGDSIEKEITLDAPGSRVWRALTDSAEFGAWFGCRMEGPFARGAVVHGRLTVPGYEHLTMKIVVQAMEAETLFSYTWHPFAVDPAVDYSAETPTLVEFRLEPEGKGTRLRVTESGFDKLPEARRDIAFRMNSGGWAQQLKNIEAYVTPRS